MSVDELSLVISTVVKCLLHVRVFAGSNAKQKTVILLRNQNFFTIYKNPPPLPKNRLVVSSSSPPPLLFTPQPQPSPPLYLYNCVLKIEEKLSIVVENGNHTIVIKLSWLGITHSTAKGPLVVAIGIQCTKALSFYKEKCK